MTRSNRLDEARHNNPRTHDAREFDARAEDTNLGWVEPAWDVDGYDPNVTTGKVRLPEGLKEDGMAYHGARFSAKGEFDPRSEELIATKGYRRPNPARIKGRPMANPQDIDAPFQIKHRDIEILYRPEAMKKKDDEWRAQAAAHQLRNAEGVVQNMSTSQIYREYNASEF